MSEISLNMESITYMGLNNIEVLHGLSLIFSHQGSCEICLNRGITHCLIVKRLYQVTLVHLGVNPEDMGMRQRG